MHGESPCSGYANVYSSCVSPCQEYRRGGREGLVCQVSSSLVWLIYLGKSILSHVALFIRFEKDVVLAYIPPCTALDRTPSSSVRMSISDEGAQVRFPPHSTRESVSFTPAYRFPAYGCPKFPPRYEQV